MSKFDVLKDLKERLLEAFKIEVDSKLTLEDIRLWKLKFSLEIDHLSVMQTMVKQNEAKVIANDCGDVKMADGPAAEPGTSIEENYGIEFDGNSLDSLETFRVDDIETSS